MPPKRDHEEEKVRKALDLLKTTLACLEEKPATRHAQHIVASRVDLKAFPLPLYAADIIKSFRDLKVKL